MIIQKRLLIKKTLLSFHKTSQEKNSLKWTELFKFYEVQQNAIRLLQIRTTGFSILRQLMLNWRSKHKEPFA